MEGIKKKIKIWQINRQCEKKKVINWQVKKDHKASHGNLNGNLKAEKYDQKGISDPTNISKCDFGTAHRNSNFCINYTVYL